MQQFNVSGCQKTVSDTNCYLSTTIELLTYFSYVNVGTKNHNFNIPLILGKYNIMTVMQELKFMQEFTSAISVECLIAFCKQNY